MDHWIAQVDVLLERIAANHAAARAEVGDMFLAFRQAAEKAGESTEALAGPRAPGRRRTTEGQMMPPTDILLVAAEGHPAGSPPQ